MAPITTIPLAEYHRQKHRRSLYKNESYTCAECGEPITSPQVAPSTSYGAKYYAYVCQKHECVAQRRRWARLKRTYGLDRDGYQALLQQQGDGCAICGSVPEGENLHVDHCHDSGRVRGLLCKACNRAIGMLDDDPNKLERAIAYLRGVA